MNSNEGLAPVLMRENFIRVAFAGIFSTQIKLKFLNLNILSNLLPLPMQVASSIQIPKRVDPKRKLLVKQL